MNCEHVIAAYSARRIGSTGLEIIGPDGAVIAWAVNEAVAVKLVALLNLAHGAGLIDRPPDDWQL